MGARTEADERLDSAKENIQKAIEDLGKIVVEQTPGYDDFNTTYRGTMADAFADMIKIRTRLED